MSAMRCGIALSLETGKILASYNSQIYRQCFGSLQEDYLRLYLITVILALDEIYICIKDATKYGKSEMDMDFNGRACHHLSNGRR